jgi:hypothetical protein
MNPHQAGELMNEQDFAETAARYLRFAEGEARGRSPLYEKFARCIANDRELLGLLLELPRERRQPNLLLATVRHLFGRREIGPGSGSCWQMSGEPCGHSCLNAQPRRMSQPAVPRCFLF